jgi:hypothetical protein
MMPRVLKVSFQNLRAKTLLQMNQRSQDGGFGSVLGPFMQWVCTPSRCDLTFLWRVRPSSRNPHSILLDVMLVAASDG